MLKDFQGNSNGYQNNNNRGGNFGYQSNFFQRSNDQSKNGENLRPMNFSDAAPFRKDFYSPSDSTKSRGTDELQALSKKYEISLSGSDCNKYSPLSLFSEAGLPENLLSDMSRQGFTQPTGIQAIGLPIVLSGRNLVGIAKTGSGKTLAYIIPALIHIFNQEPIKGGEGPIVLVLAPTRELAQQIQKVANEFGLNHGVRNTCVFGGMKRLSIASKYT